MMLNFSTINLVKVKAYFPFAFFASLLLLEILVAIFYIPQKFFFLWEIHDKVDVLTSEVTALLSSQKALAAVSDSQLALQLDVAEKILPNEKKVTGLVSGLATIASSSGVAVKSISFSPGIISTRSASLGQTGLSSGSINVGENVQAVPVSITVAASLEQLMGYLQRLQSASQLVGVTNLSFSLETAPVGGQLGVMVYFLPITVGQQSWRYIPTIPGEDLKLLRTLSGSDVFNLP